MKLKGKLKKDGKFWLIEVPVLSAITQGRTKKEDFEMIEEYIINMSEEYFSKTLKLNITKLINNEFEIETNNTILLTALVLRSLRVSQDLTIKAISEKLGYSSVNGYAQYEQSKRELSCHKLSEMLSVLNPKVKLLIDL